MLSYFKLHLLIALVLLISTIEPVYCQGSGNQITSPPVLPASPEAAALIKEGQLSVGLQNGASNLSVPIHTLKVGAFTLPINLSYSTNGFKVDEIPSRVGMNWTLNAGGVITRNVQGRPDDLYPRAVKPANYPSFTPSLETYMNDIGDDGNFDGEPDEFRFNFNGISGKFIIDDAGNIIQFPHSNLKINVASNFSEIWITNTDGIRYKFGSAAIERTSGHTLGHNSQIPYNTITSWFLFKIEILYNKSINFNYQPISINCYSGVTHTAFSEKRPNSNCPAEVSIIPFYVNGEFHESLNSVNYNTVYLSSISTSTGESILFKYDPRPDNSGDNRLKEIEIENGPLSRLYKLNYVDPPNTVYAHSNSMNSYNKRFFLNSVNESLINSSTNKVYTFEYNDIENLPPRLSYCQDHFGFYNGEVSNQNLLPPGLTSDNWSNSIANANRNPNAEFAMKGLLRKVTFPTGGNEELAYESNSGNIGGVRVKKISSFDPISNTTNNRFLFYEGMISEAYPEYVDELMYKVGCGYTNLSSETYRQTLHSNSLSNLYLYDNSHVAYSKVVESNTVDFQQGRTEHVFSVFSMVGYTLLSGYVIKDVPNGFLTSLNGYEIETSLYNGSNYLVKKIISNYELASPELHYTSLKVRKRYDIIFQPNDIYDRFDIMSYEYISKWPRLVSKENIEYNNNQTSFNNTSTSFIYGFPNNILPKEIQYLNSQQQIVKTTYSYPTDFFGVLVYDSMISRNIIDKVIEQKQLINSINTNTKKASYSFFNGLQTQINKIEEFKFTNLPEIIEQFNAYDYYGNLLEYQKNKNIKESFLWGYKSSYPVAKIIGAEQSSISALVSQSLLDNPTSDEDLRTHLNALRSLPNTLVNTYTYKPLVGMTSETDPNGKTTFYEYDNFGRLKLVRDHNNNILKKICYNYAGQTTSCLETPPQLIPQTVYARLSYENVQYSWSTTMADLVVRFYSDAACTLPLSVNNLTINYTDFNDCYGYNNNYVKESVNGNTVVLGYSVVLDYSYTECDYGYWPCYTYYCHKDYSLAPGNYVVVN